MYDFNNYDNDMAYSYDEYLENVQERAEDMYYGDPNEDYLVQRAIDEAAENFEALEYESKMAEQMIDDIYSQNN